MTLNSYGDKQYVAVQGLDKAMEFAKAVMQAHDCQVLVQNDDCDIYIVSWANRYGPDDGEQFVWMNERTVDEWYDFLASRKVENDGN